MDTNNEISSRIQRIRINAGESISKFARNIGVPRSTLVGYERNSTIPAYIITVIAEKYRVPEKWLLSGDSTSATNNNDDMRAFPCAGAAHEKDDMGALERGVLNYNRTKQIREILQLTQSEFATRIGLSRSAVSEFENGTREVSKSFLLAIKRLGVSVDWFLSGNGDVFIKNSTTKNNNDSYSPTEEDTQLQSVDRSSKRDTPESLISDGVKSLIESSINPVITVINKKILSQEKMLHSLQKQINNVKNTNLSNSAYNGRSVTDAEVFYGADDDVKYIHLPLAVNLAAGVPVEAFDTGDTYPVTETLLKKGKQYCVAKIHGTSMIDAGIPDNSHVLLEYTSIPQSGCIMVVRYGSQTTLKRLLKKEDGTWELFYEDGSLAKIELKDQEWEVQWLFVQVL